MASMSWTGATGRAGAPLRAAVPPWARRGVRIVRRLVRRVRPTPPTLASLHPRWPDIVAMGLVDAEWYRARYPAVAATGVDPALHYATEGWTLGFDPNPCFDTAWYLSTYPDVAAADRNPLVHYVEWGVRERRNPSPRFDTAWYLERHPDVARSGLDPLAHFLRHGLVGGRPPLPPASADTSTVVIVSGEPDTPGHVYRVRRLAAAMRRLGHEVRELDVPEAALNRLADLDHAALVVLWRTSWGDEVEGVVRRARRAGAVIAFDVDDAMVDPDLAVVATIDGIRSQGLTEAEAQDWFAKVRRTATAADVCIATTEALGDQLRRLGSPVFVLPNGFDDDALVTARLARRSRRALPGDGCVRIGYCSGSLTHQADFALVADAVAGVLRDRPDCRLVLFEGALDLGEFPAFDALGGQVEWRPIVPLDRLADELARFDVNLAPLEVDNPFCEAKSNLKFFEAALVEVATIASPTAAFRAVIDDGVTGLLAADPDAWRDHLAALVDDEARRRALARAAFTSVQFELGELARTQAVATILDQVLGDPTRAAQAFELARRRELDATATEAPALAAHRVVREYDRLRRSRVTVVVPVHDYAHTVVEALDSVAAQTMDDLDLIVVDDASSDDSLAVVRDWLDAHHHRFHRALLVAHDHNAGVACARNLGFDLADTAHVLALDADNVLRPTCCERLHAALGAGTAAFAYPLLEHFRSDGRGADGEPAMGDRTRNHLPYSAQRLVVSNSIDALALIRTDAWRAAGGYRRGLLGWEDYDLWCRFAELGFGGVQVPEELARYRIHDASMLHELTDVRDDEVREAARARHPWLRLDHPRDHASRPTEERAETPSPAVPRPRHAEARPVEATGESGAGPTAAPALASADDLDHVGNPLPERAVALAAACTGPILHLSGGGTRLEGARVVHLDARRYGPTDVVADAHRLPFADASFDLVVAMNAFEHYRDPVAAAAEIERVLRPGGIVIVHTAFVQPLHEEPHHYFNATRSGVRAWFGAFDEVDLTVSGNFHGGYALAWVASAAEASLADTLGPEAARHLRALPLGRVADWWRDPATRDDDFEMFDAVHGPERDRLAAGFEFVGRRR